MKTQLYSIFLYIFYKLWFIEKKSVWISRRIGRYLHPLSNNFLFNLCYVRVTSYIPEFVWYTSILRSETCCGCNLLICFDDYIVSALIFNCLFHLGGLVPFWFRSSRDCWRLVSIWWVYRMRYYTLNTWYIIYYFRRKNFMDSSIIL